MIIKYNKVCLNCKLDQLFCFLFILLFIIFNSINFLLIFILLPYNSNLNSLNNKTFICPRSADDSFEDNDDFSHAKLISPGFYEGLTQGDEDWYKFNIEKNQLLSLTLIYNSSKGYISFKLIDSNQNLIQYGSEQGDITSITYSNYAVQTLYCAVYGDNSNLKYNLNLTLSNSDDVYENNDDIYSAPEIWTGFIDDLVIMDGDEDWFMFFEDSDKMANFTLQYNTSQGELYLSIIDQSNTILKYDGDPSDGVSCTFVPDETTYYYIRIFGSSDYIKYGINYSHRLEDPFEWNNNYTAAAELIFTENFYSEDCYLFDPDWYSLNLQSDLQLSLSISSFSSNNLKINLYNGSEGCSLLSYYEKEFYYNNANFIIGPYPFDLHLFFQVSSENYTGASYSFNINKILIVDDFYEENDDIFNSREIWNEIDDSYLYLFPYDDDWYKLIPNAGEENGKRLFFNITTSFLLDDFNVEILDMDGISLINLTKSDNNYFGTYDLYSKINILIHIFANHKSIVRYSLKITSINIGKFSYEDPFGIIPSYSIFWFSIISLLNVSYLFIKKNRCISREFR
ncbi:MAG: hypothetical protein K9W44_04545 [Candidatus Lokiarchaeota archaeon]|nr:hypothetical protein [Candidatus Harpocratesius repetitus]